MFIILFNLCSGNTQLLSEHARMVERLREELSRPHEEQHQRRLHKHEHHQHRGKEQQHHHRRKQHQKVRQQHRRRRGRGPGRQQTNATDSTLPQVLLEDELEHSKHAGKSE